MTYAPTCRSCPYFQRLQIRRQWSNICRKSGKTAPMVWCNPDKPKQLELK